MTSLVYRATIFKGIHSLTTDIQYHCKKRSKRVLVRTVPANEDRMKQMNPNLVSLGSVQPCQSLLRFLDQGSACVARISALYHVGFHDHLGENGLAQF
jgi:hypothetical protein